jgi:aminoglycoside 6'-N-acetyltransferase
MSVLISDTEVSIRLMRDEPGDYQVMSKWLSDPRMLEFYERRDTHWRSSKSSLSMHRIRGEQDVTPCLIILQSVPIGYVPFYFAGEESRNSYGLPADECLCDQGGRQSRRAFGWNKPIFLFSENWYF